MDDLAVDFVDFEDWGGALPMSHGDTHPSFGTPEADIILVSCDGIKFRMMKGNLVKASVVFADMLESGACEEGGGGEVDEVPMLESSEVLEVVLPFCKPGKAKLFDTWSELWQVIKAFDKYDIQRGLSYVATTYERQFPAQDKNPVLLAEYYLFSFHYRRATLDKATQLIINSLLPWDNYDPAFARLEHSVPSDGGKLSRLMLSRLTKLYEARALHLNQRIGSRMYGTFSGGKAATGDLEWGLEMWALSAFATTPESMEEYRMNFAPPIQDFARRKVWDMLPWNELKEVLVKLPTKVE